MTDDRGNSNQRVTNAILGTKLDRVIDDLDEIKGGMALNTEARIASTERWKAHEKEHASLNTKKWAGDIGAGIAASIPGLAALFGK